MRQYQPEDCAAMATLAQQSMPYPWNEQAFMASYKAGHLGWVVELNANLAGYLVAANTVDCFELLSTCVDQNYRRQGIAKQLIDQLVCYARLHQVDRILLEVRVSNKMAIQCYQQYGFEQIALRRDYYPLSHDAREHGCVFALDLR